MWLNQKRAKLPPPTFFRSEITGKFKQYYERGIVSPSQRTDEFQLSDGVDCSIGLSHSMHTSELICSPHCPPSPAQLARLHLRHDSDSVPAMKRFRVLQVVKKSANRVSIITLSHIN